MLGLKVSDFEGGFLSLIISFYHSVGNWGSLSFILNLGAFVQIWVRWFRLRHSSTPFSTRGIYLLGLSID